MFVRARLTVCGALAVAVLAGTALPASAQIYTWRDNKGTLVLSDRPLDASARLFDLDRSQVGSSRPDAPVAPGRFDGLITRLAAEQGLRPDLVRAVIQVESGFDAHARSPKGALGLMQLMPATAMELGVTNPFNPVENIRGGTRYLRRMLDRYGSEELALAAYNAGPGAVDRYGRRVPPYAETQNYVRLVRDKVSLGNLRTPHRVYKALEVLHGRTVPHYSNVAPVDDEPGNTEVPRLVGFASSFSDP